MLAVLFEVAVAIVFFGFLVHSLRQFKARSVLCAVVLVGFIGWLQEFLAQILTDAYWYSGFSVVLLNTPLAIVLAWILASYVSFLVALQTKRFVVGALAGASIDLLLEPLAFYGSLWTWKPVPFPDLLYFTAPFGNALGWILWCFIGAKLFNRLLKLK